MPLMINASCMYAIEMIVSSAVRVKIGMNKQFKVYFMAVYTHSTLPLQFIHSTCSCSAFFRSPTLSRLPRNRSRIAAENSWRLFSENLNKESSIFRLGGWSSQTAMTFFHVFLPSTPCICKLHDPNVQVLDVVSLSFISGIYGPGRSVIHSLTNEVSVAAAC